MSYTVSQRVREILVSGKKSYPFVDTAAGAVIKDAQEDLADLLQRSGHAIQLEGPVARWWTFAGGQVNHTLKYALEWLEDWKVVPDNFLVRVQGDGITHETSRSAIARMSAPGFWESDDTRSEILARVPEYRLSKFQVALPEWAAAEMVGAYVLDFGGTASFLTGEAG